tara:strand:- start:8288 stop:9769 length:1482 start_codon:yes stop_codon:yes gene_type:complete
MTLARFLLLSICTSSLAACALESKNSPFTGWYKGYSDCRAEYAAMDERVAAAGVGTAQFYRVPGYPYLRTNRTLASFRYEVQGLEEVSEWLRRMRDLDQEARYYEYLNLGMTDLEHANQRHRFQNCGRILAAIELEDEAAWARLLDIAVPSDAYSNFARTLGLYPLAAVAMKSRAAQHWSQVRHELATPPEAGDPRLPMRLWKAKAVENLDLLDEACKRNLSNALGFPALVGSEWRALAELHAPQMWIETASQGDLPATPAFTQGGLTADSSRATAYYDIAHARSQMGILIQISYHFWFKSSAGADNGPLNGLVWRVTLNKKLQPLTYESMEASGIDHRWYRIQNLTIRTTEDWWQEPQFVAPEFAPQNEVAVRLRASTHEVRAAISARALGDIVRNEYLLQPYENLYLLDRPGGGTRSLFGPNGLIESAWGQDAIGGMASGILKPGVPRQLRHHAIAHVGRRHFDDPYLLDTTFVLPADSDAPQAPLAQSMH